MTTSKELLKRFSVNARYLCKQKGKKIGDLETEIGAAQGYFSRIVTFEKATNLAHLYKTAQALETSIDDLLSEDMMIKHRIQELEEELNLLKERS